MLRTVPAKSPVPWMVTPLAPVVTVEFAETLTLAP